MSSAFVKENEEQWLHEISPTMTALIDHLSRENNGIRVYLKKTTIESKTGEEIYHMSNGLPYTKDKEGKWCIA